MMKLTYSILLKYFGTTKKQFFLITSFVAICSLIYSLMLPNIYKAEALLAPSGDSDDSSISRMPNEFIGIASLAGFSLPTSGVSKVDLGLEVLKSRKFVREFVERHKILPQLMAVDYWDVNTRKLVLDDGFIMTKIKKFGWVVMVFHLSLKYMQNL